MNNRTLATFFTSGVTNSEPEYSSWPRSLRKRSRLLLVVSLSLLTFAVACGGGGDSNAESTPTSTPLVGDRAPTAEAPIPPTPIINATPISTVTAGATTSPDVLTSPTPTGFASPGTPGPTPSPGQSPSTEIPAPSPTPGVIQSGQELVNEPLGVLQLRPGFGRAVQYSAGVDVTDFRVNVGFKNPFHPSFSPWNYGLKFRDDGNNYQMFVLDHESNLNYIKGTGTVLEIVDTVTVPQMMTSGGGVNDLIFLVIEDKAFIFVDRLLVKIYTVDGADKSGELSLITDIYNETTVVGAQTEFFDLVINSAGLVGQVVAGNLSRPGPAEIAVGQFSLETSAGYARVTLVSPFNAFSADYSFGLLFRTEATGYDNWLVFDDSKEWRHMRRSTSGADFQFSRGIATNLDTRQGKENVIEFLSTGVENKVYLNGELLLNLAIPPEDQPFTIAPMAGFEPGHQLGEPGTEFRDFAVWSVAQ